MAKLAKLSELKTTGLATKADLAPKRTAPAYHPLPIDTSQMKRPAALAYAKKVAPASTSAEVRRRQTLANMEKRSLLKKAKQNRMADYLKKKQSGTLVQNPVIKKTLPIKKSDRQWGETLPGYSYPAVEGPGNPSWERRNPIAKKTDN
jgi:hypothetical protein